MGSVMRSLLSKGSEVTTADAVMAYNADD
jgi:hypothetical protein